MQYRDLIAMVFVVHKRLNARKPELTRAIEDLSRMDGNFGPTDVLPQAMKILLEEMDEGAWRNQLTRRNGNVSNVISNPAYMESVPMTENVPMLSTDSRYIKAGLAHLMALSDPQLKAFKTRYHDIYGTVLNYR